MNARSKSFTLDKGVSAQYAFDMSVNWISRKLAAFVLALGLLVGGAPVAMAGSGMDDCGMVMGFMAMDMQSSMTQDQYGMDMSKPMPVQKHQTPCKDMGGICTATCGSTVSLQHVGYLPVLASRPAEPGWASLTEFASVSSRPDIPPPIATL